MSPLVTKALEKAGLADLAQARLRGEIFPEARLADLVKADLLALGAFADAVRARAAGDDVHFRKGDERDVVWVKRDEPGADGSGLGVLRRVAILRIVSPDHVRIGVNYTDTGLELAQVSLGFGASELTGVLANKRGLPIADDATKRVKGQGQVSAQTLQKKELATVLGYVGKKAIFDEKEAPARGAEATVLEGGDHA